MEKKNNKIQKLFDFFTKDFEEDSEPTRNLIEETEGVYSVQEFRIKLPIEVEINSPFIVFIIFVHLKGFRFFGKDEKVAWVIPIKYKGRTFVLTHRKFGFRIISNFENEELNSLGIEAMTKINKAIPYAEILFEPFIKERVNLGLITLDNQYNKIKSRYIFFRKKAASEFKKSNKGKTKTDGEESEGFKLFSQLLPKYDSSISYSIKGNNFATAMLDSYFCLIEHTFVLLLPFLNHINIEEINLEEFIGENWKQKLKKIIPLTGDREALKLYEGLEKIKEELRNPLTHGYFLKSGNSFFVHIPHLGAVPMSLTRKKNQLHYSCNSINNLNFEDICNCFDDFDKFLKNRLETKFGMLFIEMNLEVSFDKLSSQIYKSAMISKKIFNKFMEHQIMIQDNASNMDW